MLASGTARCLNVACSKNLDDTGKSGVILPKTGRYRHRRRTPGGRLLAPARTSSVFSFTPAGAAAPPLRGNALWQIAEACLKPRHGEIQEGPQLHRHEAIGRVDEADRPRRRLAILKQWRELSGFDRFGHVIGKGLGDPD